MTGLFFAQQRRNGLCLAALLVGVLLATGCTDQHGHGEATGDEPPFFTADRNATGPLTLAELQIHIPDDIGRDMSDAQRACFLEAVERRAAEAGDPAELDPDNFVYWGGNVSLEEWRQHGPYMQRVLLGQAIITWAMMDC